MPFLSPLRIAEPDGTKHLSPLLVGVNSLGAVDGRAIQVMNLNQHIANDNGSTRGHL